MAGKVFFFFLAGAAVFFFSGAVLAGFRSIDAGGVCAGLVVIAGKLSGAVRVVVCGWVTSGAEAAGRAGGGWTVPRVSMVSVY